MTLGGVFANLIFLLLVLGMLKLGFWICKRPEHFMDLFNPYMKPYSRMTLQLVWFWGLMLVFGSIVGAFGVAGELFPDSLRGVLLFVGVCVGAVVTTRAYKRHRAVLGLSNPGEHQR